MVGLTDEVGWDVECPNCGKRFRATAVEIEDDPLLPCPHCGEKIKVENRGKLRKLAESLKSIARKLIKPR
jgi:DNA-directed RNA polymerase subunit RPC12/RpoP